MTKNILFSLILSLFFHGVSMAQDSEYVLRFDNSTENQSIKYDDDVISSMMDGATDYTIEMWVKPTDATVSGDVWFGMRNMFRLTYYYNHRFYFTHKDASGGGETTNLFFNSTEDAITLNAWNHVAVICNSTDGDNGSLKLYVNGVDMTAGTNDAISLVGGDANNDVFVSYGGGDYSNMYAREIRVLKRAISPDELSTDLSDSNYSADDDTAVLFHFAEGEGLTTINEASGINANFGFGGSHYPTWVLLSETVVGNTYFDSTVFNSFPNPSNGSFSIKSKDLIKTIQITDVLGKKVFSESVGSNATTVNTNLTKGIYLMQIVTSKGSGTQKIVVE